MTTIMITLRIDTVIRPIPIPIPITIVGNATSDVVKIVAALLKSTTSCSIIYG